MAWHFEISQRVRDNIPFKKVRKFSSLKSHLFISLKNLQIFWNPGKNNFLKWLDIFSTFSSKFQWKSRGFYLEFNVTANHGQKFKALIKVTKKLPFQCFMIKKVQKAQSWHSLQKSSSNQSRFGPINTSIMVLFAEWLTISKRVDLHLFKHEIIKTDWVDQQAIACLTSARHGLARKETMSV